MACISMHHHSLCHLIPACVTITMDALHQCSFGCLYGQFSSAIALWVMCGWYVFLYAQIFQEWIVLQWIKWWPSIWWHLLWCNFNPASVPVCVAYVIFPSQICLWLSFGIGSPGFKGGIRDSLGWDWARELHLRHCVLIC